eukprot:Gb_02221 [translate_table: standard]
MISPLLAEEKRAIKRDSQPKFALYSKKRMEKRTIGKSEMECYNCGKAGHTTINCEICTSDLLKGKLKESTNIAIIEDPPDIESDDDLTKEEALFKGDPRSGSLTSYLYEGDETLHVQMVSNDARNLDYNWETILVRGIGSSLKKSYWCKNYFQRAASG